MIRLAAGLDVQVSIVASAAGGLHGIVLLIFGERLETIKHFLADEITLLDPTLGAIRGAHFDEALLTIENVDTVAVLYGRGLVVDGGYTIAQKCLRSRDVH